MGAGLASGKDWGDGLGKAGLMALRARPANPRQQQQAQLALWRMLMANGANRMPTAAPSIPGLPTR
jgi:hypothetical protein